MSLVLAVTLMSALLEILLAVPLILRKIPRNNFYGFRVSKTLSDDKIWYSANKRFGVDLAVAGLVTLLGSMTCVVFFENNQCRESFFIALLLVPVLFALIDSFLYLKKL